MYDVRSRGAESYIRLAKEILDRDMPELAVKSEVIEELAAAVETEEKQVVNALVEAVERTEQADHHEYYEQQ